MVNKRENVIIFKQRRQMLNETSHPKGLKARINAKQCSSPDLSVKSRHTFALWRPWCVFLSLKSP